MTELRNIDLQGVVRVAVRPLTAAALTMIESQVRATLADWREKRLAGQAAPTGEIDLENADLRSALYESLVAKGVLMTCVVGWESLRPDFDLPSCSPLAVSEVFESLPLIARELHHRLMMPWLDRAAEKNGSRPAPNGTVGAGPAIADAAATTASPALPA